MKNYEYIIKDLDSLIEFVKANEIRISCDECNKYGLECSDCTKNTIKYLTMDRVEGVVPKNGLSTNKFNDYLDKIRTLRSDVCDTYTQVNYVRNYMKDLEDNDIVFTNNQKDLLSMEFKRIDSAINNLESLKGTIEKYK